MAHEKFHDRRRRPAESRLPGGYPPATACAAVGRPQWFQAPLGAKRLPWVHVQPTVPTATRLRPTPPVAGNGERPQPRCG
jgi:hypothetical protein